MMNNRTFTTELGTIDLGAISFLEDNIQILIDIDSVSEELQQEIDKSIEEAKIKVYENMKTIYSRKGLQWSKSGVEVNFIYLSISIDENKKLETSLCAGFTDKENDLMYGDAEIKVDLSAYAEELKAMILKAIVGKFF